MDDDENILEATGDLLRYLGYDRRGGPGRRGGADPCARRPRKSSRPFDLAILDLDIGSGTGGMEAGQKLRSRRTPSSSLVVSSGYMSRPGAGRPRASMGSPRPSPSPTAAELLSRTIAEVLGLRSPGVG